MIKHYTCIAALALTGCATNLPIEDQLANLQHQVAASCSIVKPVLESIALVAPTLAPLDVAAIDAVSPLVAKACVDVTTGFIPSAADFVGKIFPTIIDTLTKSKIPDQQKQTALLAVTGAKIAIGIAYAQAGGQ